MQIKIDDLSGLEITQLLREHLKDMRLVSPPESKHALDLDELCKPDITFWTIWEGNSLTGCVALKKLDSEHGELKSMRTSNEFQRKGVASILLQHIIFEAQKRRYKKISLETGSIKYFEPARQLYIKFGFKVCAPFANYKEDSNSVFMTLEI